MFVRRVCPKAAKEVLLSEGSLRVERAELIVSEDYETQKRMTGSNEAFLRVDAQSECGGS